MARNLRQFGRREIDAHRRFVTGVTASVPAYKAVDLDGNKEWVVDVYLGPLERVEKNIVRDVPIAPYARQLVGDIRQPVLLDRSKQGRYTVVGRAKTLPSGLQTPEGSILEPTYHRIDYNLAALGLTFVADLDWTREPWGEKEWGEAGKPWQEISAANAFGRQVVGGELDPEDEIALYRPAAEATTTTRHVLTTRKTWGPAGSPDALVWGTDPWGASLQKVLESVS